MGPKEKVLGVFPKKYLIILSGALFYTYQSILRVAPAVMNDQWLLDFSIDAKQLGFILSFYYWSYAGIQMPLGVLLDRFGAARWMVLAAFLCASSCFLLSTTHSTAIASCAMFLMGLGAACAFLGSVKLGTIWFCTSELVKVVAFLIIMGSVGQALGGKPLTLLVEAYGWQHTMKILGIVGIFLTVFLYVAIGRVPEPKIYEAHQKSAKILEGLKQVVRTPQAWCIALYGMLMYTPMLVYANSSGIPFIKASYGYSEGDAAWVLSAMVVGAAIGSPIFAFYSDWISKRVQPMILGAFIGLIIQLLVLYVPNLALPSLLLLFFMIGVCYTAKTISFTAVCEIMPKSCSGVAVGFLNTLTMGAGTFILPLVGKLLVYHSGSRWTLEGSPIYTESDYRFALSVVPICLFCALLLMWFIKETHHAAQEKEDSDGNAKDTSYQGREEPNLRVTDPA